MKLSDLFRVHSRLGGDLIWLNKINLCEDVLKSGFVVKIKNDPMSRLAMLL